MNKIILTLLFAAMAYSQMIDGVALIVGKKPITLFEIERTRAEFKFSKSEAIEYLINKKIEEQKIAQLGIKVEDYEVEERIGFVAKQNGLTIEQLREALASRFVGWESYKEKIKQSVVNEKLSREVLSNELVTADESDGRIYYEQHKGKYQKPSKVEVIKYISSGKEELVQTIKNPLRKSSKVSFEKETADIEKMNPQLVKIILRTEEGEFTPVIPIGENFLAIYVEKKLGLQQQSYEEVKNEILEELNIKNREKAVKNYFTKERSKVKITYLR